MYKTTVLYVSLKCNKNSSAVSVKPAEKQFTSGYS